MRPVLYQEKSEGAYIQLPPIKMVKDKQKQSKWHILMQIFFKALKILWTKYGKMLML